MTQVIGRVWPLRTNGRMIVRNKAEGTSYGTFVVRKRKYRFNDVFCKNAFCIPMASGWKVLTILFEKAFRRDSF